MTCCGKRHHEARRDAVAELELIQQSRSPRRLEQRAYCCWRCSQLPKRPIWHLTSEPLIPREELAGL